MASSDVDDEFREIKREIIESRGLVIKSNNTTTALAADVRSIAKRQAGYERRLTVNSATAYALFVVLTFGGLKLWLDASVRENRTENESLRRQIERDHAESAALARERDERTALDGRAMTFYELVREGKRQEAVEAWQQLRREHLSTADAAFFQDRVDQFRTDLSLEAFQRGLEHARLARYVQAYEAYDEAIRMREDAGHISRVRVAQADALRHLGRQREAIVVLQAVVDAGDEEAGDDAMLLIAHCQTDLQLWGDARTTLRSLLRRFPYGSVSHEAALFLSMLTSPMFNPRLLR